MADIDPSLQALYSQTFGSATPQSAAPTAAASPAPTAAAMTPQDLYNQTFNAPTPPSAGTKWLPSSLGEFARDAGNNLVRAGAKAIWALPGMAEDLGVAARDLIAGRGPDGRYPYQLPSTTFNQALDQVTNAPTTTGGKVGEFASSAMLGSLLGGPTYKPSAVPGGGPVPNNFVAPQPSLSTAQQNLIEARRAGYVFPPSTVNPTIANKTIEAIGGKAATAQDASLANMPTTTNIARQALIDSGADIAPEQELTPQLLAEIRAKAATAKANVVSKSGAAVNLDQPYANTIAQVTAPYRQAAQELGPQFGNEPLVGAADAINKPQITPSVAMKAITQLRDKAQVAFRQGDNTTGGDYKTLATNLEDAIDRHLTATGNQGAVDAYRSARALQAKTYDVEDALNATTGQVNAGVLKKAPYLSGPLATIAKAAEIAPKATKEIVDSGSVRNTDVITGGLAAVMGKDPKFLLYPFARQAVRAAMLSNTGQNLMLGKLPQQAVQLGPVVQQGLMSGWPQSFFSQWNLANQ